MIRFPGGIGQVSKVFRVIHKCEHKGSGKSPGNSAGNISDNILPDELPERNTIVLDRTFYQKY